MRRLPSIFLTSAALVAGVFATASVVSAAGGTVTKKTSATVAPAAVPNAKILSSARLTKSNSFLVMGVDKSTAGAHVYLWKIKDDLTIDATFPAVDLGNDFATPTASNSSCVAMQQNSNMGATCYYTSTLAVNETAGVYAFAMSRNLNGSGNSSNVSAEVTTLISGKISNGAVTGKMNNVSVPSSLNNIADWSAYGTDVFKSSCTSIFGATYQSVALSTARSNIWMITIRPDGSLVYDIQCSYSNQETISSGSPGVVKDFSASAALAVKASNGALVTDTTWGTNGVLKTFDDATKCGFAYPSATVDSSISANSSTKIFSILQKNVSARSTTAPSWISSRPGVTGYDGCSMNGPSSSGTNYLSVIEADGSLKGVLEPTSAAGSYMGRWVIDPAGRWNTLTNTGTNQAPKYSLMRINVKGEFDTTLGANGIKEIPNMPTTVSVNGTNVVMHYALTGFGATATGFYFTGMSVASPNSFMCDNSTITNTFYPYYLSPDTGLVTTYGTNGLGEGVSITDISRDMCGSDSNLIFVNSKGQHSMFQQTIANGSQTAGILSATWDAAEGVISGGDGVGATGPSGRTDTKVYSKSLPSKVEDDTALTVLTKKQAKDLDLRSTTPKVCVALTTDVLMLNPGKCTVQVIDEETKKVLRTMRTTVAQTEQEVGSTLTTDEPIMFKQASSKVSAAALEQVKAIADAAGSAKKVVVIGHSAALGEVSQYSFAISRDRANAIKAALVKAGVKASIIETVALSYDQPLSTKKTTKSQEKNRRVEVFILE